MATPSLQPPENEASQVVLKLVARGNAIVAELKRLAHYIPREFLLQDRNDQRLYGDILADFAYFSTPDPYDNKRESDSVRTNAI